MRMLHIVALVCCIHKSEPQPDYIGRVPCPSNTTIIGYTSTDLLNEDIVADMKYYIFENRELPSFFHYILCPETTFEVASSRDSTMSEGESPIIPGLANSFFTCGEDGNSENKCIFSGGDFHFYFPDFIIADEVYLMGLTFENAEVASVYGDAHPASHVIFLDCHWKNNTGSAATFIHYTPEEARRNRMLKTDQPYNLDDVYQIMLEDAESLSKKKFLRELQPSVKLSMSCVFVNCSFVENNNELATIFNVGGAAELIGTSFTQNNATELAIFTNVGNAHAFIHKETSFLKNSARLGPVYVDNQSFLQLSRDNSGNANTGGQCDGIFLEDQLSSCFGKDKQCTGNCCEFGDESCDLLLEDDQMEVSQTESESTLNTASSTNETDSEESSDEEIVTESEPLEGNLEQVDTVIISESSTGTHSKCTFSSFFVITIIVLLF